MMFWYDHDVSGWGWFAMAVSMVLFWALIITVAVLLFRAFDRASATGEHGSAPAALKPEEVLAGRFARGEIDDEEYRRRLATLQDSSPLTKL